MKHNVPSEQIVTKEDIILITEKLKKYGPYIIRVMDKSGYSRPTVTKFFELKKIKLSSTMDIYDTVLEIIDKEEQRRLHRRQRIKNLADDQPSLFDSL